MKGKKSAKSNAKEKEVSVGTKFSRRLFMEAIDNDDMKTFDEILAKFPTHINEVRIGHLPLFNPIED